MNTFIASIALLDGPSGFSLDASFITPLIPISLSSSSIGLPGWYGTRFFMLSLTNLSMLIAHCYVLFPHRIRPKHLKKRTLMLQFFNGLPYLLILNMPLNINKEYILPDLFPRRP